MAARKTELSPHFLVIEARFYPEIADALFTGATQVLEEQNCTWDRVQVPGAFEIPAAIAMVLAGQEEFKDQNYDGYITLGCVIRGETTHYDYVCTECARGVNSLAIDYGVPVGFGVLTVENYDQAMERAHIDKRNKGADAANAALIMAKLQRHFRG